MLYKIPYLPLSPLLWIWRKLKVDKIKIPTCANILLFSPEDEYIELLRPQIDKLMPDRGNPRWQSGKNSLPANVGDTRGAVSIPGLGRSQGVGDDHPLQYSCLPMWFSPLCGNNFHLGLFLRFWPHSSIVYRNLFKGLSLTWGRFVVAIRILKPPLQQD